MAVFEPGQYRYWIAKQTAKGAAPAVAAYQALGVIDGDVSVAVDYGRVRYPTYGGRYYSGQSWVNGVRGAGELTALAHPDAVLKLAGLHLGADAISGAADPYTHVLTPAAASPWCALFKKAGVAEGSGAGAPLRNRFNDCRIDQFVLEASTANKEGKATARILSTDPGDVRPSGDDPTGALPTERAFVFTDGTGAFKFSANTGTAIVVPSTVEFRLELNDDFKEAPGDDITPLDYLPGESTATIRIACTAETASLGELYKIVYGTATPGTGAKPVATIPALGSVDILLTQAGVTPARTLRVEIAGVQWAPEASIPTNTSGEAVQLAFAGEARLRGANPMVRITGTSALSTAVV